MNLENRLAQWVTYYEESGYLNGSLLIASNEKIYINKGIGMANWEHMVPNKPTTKFRIGSLTKAFTSFAIFQLHEEKKLNIHDCIGKYIRNYPQDNKITIYHCLTNTSGIPNFTSFDDFWFKSMRLPSTLEELIDSFKNMELEFEPGSRFEYSNSGYIVLTAIIESVSNMSYAEYIKEKICLPLGMKNTGCDDGVHVIPNLASGYSFWEKPIHAAYTDLTFPLGAYGLYSTTEDLLIWDKALNSPQLLSDELKKLMVAPNHSSYACGWMVSDMFGRKAMHHFGDISGYCSDLVRFTEDNLTIIFLSNMSITPVTHLTREIAKVMFKEDLSVCFPFTPIDFTDIESKVGNYFVKGEQYPKFHISMKNAELFLTVPKLYGIVYKFKLVPVKHDSLTTMFVTEMIDEQLTFYYSLLGELEYVEYKDFYGQRHIVNKKF